MVIDWKWVVLPYVIIVILLAVMWYWTQDNAAPKIAKAVVREVEAAAAESDAKDSEWA